MTQEREAHRNCSASRRLWGLDWGAVLPWSIGDVSVAYGTFADALEFIGEHYAQIFRTAESPFFSEPIDGAKRRFYDDADTFLYRHAGRTVGIFVAHPSDWATYYMRTAALLPEYRSRGIVSEFMQRICEPLRAAGVARLEGDVSPSNQPMMRLHVGQGFQANASACSERWGLMVHFTRYLRPEAEAIFQRQFCSVVTKPNTPQNPERSAS